MLSICLFVCLSVWPSVTPIRECFSHRILGFITIKTVMYLQKKGQGQRSKITWIKTIFVQIWAFSDRNFSFWIHRCLRINTQSLALEGLSYSSISHPSTFKVIQAKKNRQFDSEITFSDNKPRLNNQIVMNGAQSLRVSEEMSFVFQGHSSNLKVNGPK